MHEMEYGDVVPMGGFRHIGATTLPKESYQHWLDIQISVAKPLETAEALEVTSAPTHGRRFAKALEGKDYSLTRLTPAAFHRFDTSLILDREQNEVWGFRYLQSPIFTEALRKTIGATIGTAGRISLMAKSLFFSPPAKDIRDQNQVLHRAYLSPLEINPGLI